MNQDELGHESITESPCGIQDVDPCTTGCGYEFTKDQRFELIKAGFVIEESNHLGFSFASKLNYVYNDKIYAKHFDGDIWRIVYLGQPAVMKHSNGKFTCGAAYGYSTNGDHSKLQHVSLGSIEFIES